MKEIILIILVITMTFLYGCNKEAANQFEIYLVVEEAVDINKLTLKETPILTSNDIIKYYWDEQVFVTKKGLISERILAQTDQHIPVSGLPYVVVVNGERIYMGKFWTVVSSAWPFSPSIMVETAMDVDLERFDVQDNQKLYSIYWNTDDTETRNIIFDERIYNVLKQNNLLSK